MNKETHNSALLNIVFVDKTGRKRRVAYNRVAEFISNNYVSNVVIDNGTIKVLGCSLTDLPDYQMQNDGSYVKRGLYDENWVYSKAQPFVLDQERKLREDVATKTVKGMSDNNDSGGSFSSNLRTASGIAKSVSDTAKAAALTSVVTAGTAAVGGVVAGTVMASKAIGKKLNEKSIKDLQVDICK